MDVPYIPIRLQCCFINTKSDYFNSFKGLTKQKLILPPWNLLKNPRGCIYPWLGITHLIKIVY